MPKKQGIGLAIAAFAVYISGGIMAFGGLALIFFMKNKDLLGWGEGRSNYSLSKATAGWRAADYMKKYAAIFPWRKTLR